MLLRTTHLTLFESNMRTNLLCMLLFAPFAIFSQTTSDEFDPSTWESPYTLDSPEGWDIERFPIPISFAPKIQYKGVEDLRFMPGWGKAESAEYWTYAFLWYLEGNHKLTVKKLESNMREYYSGLASAMQKENVDPESIKARANIKKGKRQDGDLKTFYGTVDILDYKASKPISLYCKVHLKSCEGQNNTFMFFELSPQNYNHSVWENLDALWTNFRCERLVDTNKQ